MLGRNQMGSNIMLALASFVCRGHKDKKKGVKSYWSARDLHSFLVVSTQSLASFTNGSFDLSFPNIVVNIAYVNIVWRMRSLVGVIWLSMSGKTRNRLGNRFVGVGVERQK